MRKLNKKFSLLANQMPGRKSGLMAMSIVIALLILSVSVPSATTGIGK